MPADVIDQNDRRLSTDSVSIRDYIDNRIGSLEHLVSSEVRRLEDVNAHIRISAETEKASLERQFGDERTAMQRQFQAIGESTRIATSALDKRLEGMNEFRAQMNDWAGRFITRAEITERVGKLESEIVTRSEHATMQGAMNERVSGLEKVSNNLQGRLWAVAAIMVVLELALRFIPLATAH